LFSLKHQEVFILLIGCSHFFFILSTFKPFLAHDKLGTTYEVISLSSSFSYLVNLSGLWEFSEAIMTEDFFLLLLSGKRLLLREKGTKKKLNKNGQRVNESI